jgi:hypothetical protein
MSVKRRHHQIAGKPLELLTTKSDGKPSDGQANDRGYGNNVKRLGNPQPSPKGFLNIFKPMDAVQRLKVDGQS